MIGAQSDYETEPDVVILDDAGAPVAILDAKYKPPNKPIERADVNQIITYAAAYNVDVVGVIVPGVSATAPRYLGSVRSHRVYAIGIDLASSDRQVAEQTYADSVRQLTAAALHANPH